MRVHSEEIPRPRLQGGKRDMPNEETPRATVAGNLLVIEPEVDRARRIEEYTPLYKRYDDVVRISRVYCKPEQLKEAQVLLGSNPTT